MTSQQPSESVVIASPASGSASPEMVRELRDLVEHSRRRWRTLIILEAVGLTVALPLAYLWLVFWLDNVLHLPVWGRLCASVFFFVCCAYLFRRLGQSWKRSRFTEDEVALAIERRTPGGLDNRLINSLQLARSDQAAAISQSVVAENFLALKQLHLEQSAALGPALIRLLAGAVVVAIGLGFWILGHEHFTNAAVRIFLPFANVAPVYQTVLAIEPGDVTVSPGADVVLRIRIDGKAPEELIILTDSGAEQATHALVVEKGQRSASYTLRNVNQSLAYAVRGNDYVSRYFQIHVPTKLELERLQAVLEAPAYTKLPPRPLESVSGDLEALLGTRGKLIFCFNQPMDQAWMALEAPVVAATTQAAAGTPAEADLATAATAPAAGAQTQAAAVRRVALTKLDSQHFEGQIEMRDVAGYTLEAQRGAEPVQRTRRFELRVTPDHPPALRLAGVDADAKLMIDSVLALRLSAKDDYGLRTVGLFYRVLSKEAPGAAQTQSAEEWRAIQTWPVGQERVEFAINYPLPLALLEVVEGQKVELAIRGQDSDPGKGENWHTSDRTKVLISGAGVDLQLAYEQILHSQEQIQELIRGHEKQVEAASSWMEKLSPLSGLRWDDAKTVETLAQAMAAQAASEATLRQQAVETARGMVDDSGNLKISVGMLADTELVRCIRILEEVSKRENPQAMRSALADARLTQQRIIRSLTEVLDHYRNFRSDWELGHMVSFTKMLMERQQAMAASAGTYAQLPAELVGPPQKRAAAGRQSKLWDLAQLASTAFGGMAGRTSVVGPVMAQAFGVAGQGLAVSELREAMAQASNALVEGQWSQAHTHQSAAGQRLESIYTALRQAQTAAAEQALAELKKLAGSDLEAQKAIAELEAGSNIKNTDIADDEDIMGQIIKMQQLADALKKKKHEGDREDGTFPDYKWNDSMAGALQGGRPEKPDFSILKLATAPGGQSSFPESSGLKENAMKTKLLEGQYEDLVGDLLEEADDLRDQYETYNLNKHGQGVEEGDIGKQAGDLNSMSAAAPTGNQKPPTHNFGGASRLGRQGARAHGLAVGDETIDRRGRDEAQEGQQEMPDQAGELKEITSDDPQKDSSTGVGGKQIKSDQTHFSTKDAGEWKDEYAGKLKDPQAINQIVERQGKPMDPKLAQMMRDLNSNQEQVIERIKAVKKQLDALYLPSDHLEDILKALEANLERLKEKPDAEVFRQQVELLDKLKGAVMVFGQAGSDFEQSLPRPQVIRSRILDEPAYPTLPGYENAVQRYYEKLAGQ